MLPPGALENADNPDLATGQKIITTSCSFILNKLNFVGRGVQRTQNFQDLAHGLLPLPLEPVLSNFYTPTDEQHYRELGFIAVSMIGIGEVLYYFES